MFRFRVVVEVENMGEHGGEHDDGYDKNMQDSMKKLIQA